MTTIEVGESEAIEGLSRFLDQVIDHQEVVIIHRRKGKLAALIAASEVTSLLETAYLLRSSVNAERLLTALNDALKGDGRPMGLTELRDEIGLDGQAA